ncbi:DUF86 domain-containing protein [Thermodesulfobacteriota bacterium]
MTANTDKEHLAAILTAARLIRSFIKDVERDSFITDLIRRSAVTGQIIRMSGAAKRISAEFKASHPYVPWDAVTDAGDKLVRSRDGVDPNSVWRFSKGFVPELILKIAGLVPRAHN